jgi:3-mercaptopyruvate sulfurtransferase SseA
MAFEEGVRDVAVLEGGIQAWWRAGYPTEGEPLATSTPAATAEPIYR